MGELDGKIAVITGAGSGMGRASVEVFVREGATVVAADVTGAEQDTAAAVGGDVLAVHCDVTREADVEAMIATAVEAHGRVDALLNVAGIADACMIADITMEHYDRLMDVDLRGVVLGMKHGIRAMLESGGGSIVNWSSLGGLGGSPYTGVYTMAKHGVVGATKVGAIEYGSKGIRINAVCPGFIVTAMSAGAENLPEYQGKAALGARRPARGGGRGRRFPGVGTGVVRQRGLHPGRRRLGREAGLTRWPTRPKLASPASTTAPSAASR